MSAVVENIQLVLKERLARDMKLWDMLLASYSSDAQIRISWYQGDAKGFVEGSRRLADLPGMQVLHDLQPPAVWLNKDETRGAVVLGAVITSRSTIKDDAKHEVLVDVQSHARMLYTTVVEGGHWKIRSLDCVYLKDDIKPALPGAELTIERQSVCHSPRPPSCLLTPQLDTLRPSYRMLAWTMQSRGSLVNHDLPGDDRPEGLAHIYKEVFSWIGAEDLIG